MEVGEYQNIGSSRQNTVILLYCFVPQKPASCPRNGYSTPTGTVL